MSRLSEDEVRKEEEEERAGHSARLSRVGIDRADRAD